MAKLSLLSLAALVVVLVILAPTPAHADKVCCCYRCDAQGFCKQFSCGTCPALCGAGGVIETIPGVSDLWTSGIKHPYSLQPDKEGQSAKCAEAKSTEKYLTLDWNKRVEGIEKSIWQQ